jgi:hypothetical protein
MRNQRRSAVIKPTHAHSPQSVSAFQRAAHRPIRYWAWTRCGDSLAGLADRDHHKPEDTPSAARLHDPQPSTASSPWLARLSAEYAGAVEEERLATMAAISVLSAQWVAAAQTGAQAAADAELARQRRTELATMALDPAPSTAGEHYESATAILSRRLATRRRQDADVIAELRHLAAVQARSAAALADYADAITANWNALLVRVATLTAFYTRRAATYTRRFRSWRLPKLRPPEIEAPAWAQGACPWFPPAVTTRTTRLAGLDAD